MDPDAQPRGRRAPKQSRQRQRAQEEEEEREQHQPQRVAEESPPRMICPRQSRVDAAPQPQMHEPMQDEHQYEAEMIQQQQQPQEQEPQQDLPPPPEPQPHELYAYSPSPQPEIVRSGALLMAQLLGDEEEEARVRAREQKEAEAAAAAAAAVAEQQRAAEGSRPLQKKGSQPQIDPWDSESIKRLPPDPLSSPPPVPQRLSSLQHGQWIGPKSKPVMSGVPPPSPAALLRADLATLDHEAVSVDMIANGLPADDARRPPRYIHVDKASPDQSLTDPYPSPEPIHTAHTEGRRRAPRANSRSNSSGSGGGGRNRFSASSESAVESSRTPRFAAAPSSPSGASASEPTPHPPRSAGASNASAWVSGDRDQVYAAYAKKGGPDFSSVFNEQAELLERAAAGARKKGSADRGSSPQPMEYEDDESDDENRPLRNINDALQDSPAATARSSAPQNRPFKPPQSSGTAASAAASSAPLSAPAPGLTRPYGISSLAAGADLCPLRFFPPSFLRYFYKAHAGRPPAALAVPTDAESMSIPMTGEAGAQAGELLHTTAISSSLAAYEEYWTRQLCLLLQGHLNRVAQAFARAVNLTLANRPAGGLHASLSSEQIHVAARHQGVHYYGSHSLSLEIVDKKAIWKKSNNNAKFNSKFKKGKKRGRKGALDDDDGDEEEDSGPSVPAGDLIPYLTLLTTDVKERRSSGSGQSGCSEGDIWIISSDAQFDMGIGLDGKVNSTEAQWFSSRPTAPNKFVVFAVSVWHNFSSDKQKLRLMPLPLGQGNANTKFFSKPMKPTRVNAIRIGDCDEPALRLLNALLPAAIPNDPPVTALKSFPLLPYILHGAYWIRYREKYHPREGWMNDRERLEEARRQSQAKVQSKLHFNRNKEGGAAAAASSTSAAAALFEPLVDAVANLIPTVPIALSLLRSVKSEIESQFTLNDDQQKVLDAVAGWFWTKRQEAEADRMSDDESVSSSSAAAAAAPTDALKPTTEPIQLVHGCFGSGQLELQLNANSSECQLQSHAPLCSLSPCCRQILSSDGVDHLPRASAGCSRSGLQDQDSRRRTHERRRSETRGRWRARSLIARGSTHACVVCALFSRWHPDSSAGIEHPVRASGLD